MAGSVVNIITCAMRQDSGTFDTSIYKVFSSPESAKKELSKIADNYNSQEHFRAKNPIGQPNDLSVERLEGSFYECKLFYSIREKELIP